MSNEHYSQDLLIFLRKMATYQLVFFVYWGTHKMKTKDSPQFSGKITDTIVSCGLELTLSRGYLRDLPFIICVLVLEMQFPSTICSKENTNEDCCNPFLGNCSDFKICMGFCYNLTSSLNSEAVKVAWVYAGVTGTRML